jgi:hypothetical protein
MHRRPIEIVEGARPHKRADNNWNTCCDNTGKPFESSQKGERINIMDNLAHLVPIIERNQDQLLVDGVQMVRPGYKVDTNGWPTKQAAIVVFPKSGATPALPATIEGVPVEVRQPNTFDQARMAQPAMFSKLAAHRPEFESGAFREFSAQPGPSVADELAPQVLSTKPQIAYTGPSDGTRLEPVEGAIPITCHASPDAGWPTLRAFLQGVKHTLTIGMYDFTSGHILKEFEGDLAGKEVILTLDHPAPNPTADQSDDQTVQDLSGTLGADFTQAWALVKTNPKVADWIFPNAYHIKVAVRDSSAVWVSSGNLNNSNQPDIDPINDPQPTDQAIAKKSDRDWHVVIESPEIARQFEAYLKHDYEVAAGFQADSGGAAMMNAVIDAVEPAAFKPGLSRDFVWHPPKRIQSNVTITPLLTPDPGVYQPEILSRIQATKSTLYIQLQYIHPSSTPGDDAFNALIAAVAQKIDDGLDVRIILSQYQKSGGWLERLQSAGINLDKVRIQNGVHNKGFIFDSKVVAAGSENWSGDGVLRNRDASVVIDNPEAAAYFEEIFLHDWDTHASQAV